jgi:hypothetical protein
MPHICCRVLDLITGAKLAYHHLIKGDATRDVWTRSFGNEPGRLAQGIQNIKGTNTIFFIPKHDVPADRTVTYGSIVVDVKPKKAEQERTRLTVGGNLTIDFPGDVSAKTSDLTTAKLLFNSVISTPDARFMGIDIKNFYLGTPMARYEYMRMPINLIPTEITEAYNLPPFVHNGYVYIEIHRGMYGFPQAGIPAQQLLQKRLATHGHRPCRHTHGLWKHDTRPTMFTLVVDNFGVKYVNQPDAQHLVDAISKSYTTTQDWTTGGVYCGVTLEWNYVNHTVDLSMPGYVANALHKFQHPTPTRPAHAPSHWNRPEYGAKIQYTSPDTSAPMTPAETLNLQKVCGTFLFYGRAVDPTMLHALNRLAATTQTRGTEATADQLVDFFIYCTTHPDSKIRLVASDMILYIHSDASYYLTEPAARSRAGGSQPPPNPPSLMDPYSPTSKSYVQSC